jgi:SAM-dependent methyltransferase
VDPGHYDTLKRGQVRRALAAVAADFPASARDLILSENLFKHLYEVRRILEHLPGDGRGVLDLGGGLGVNLLVLRRLGVTAPLVLVDMLDEYDESNRMGDWRSATAILEHQQIKVVRQNFWAEPALPFRDREFAVTTCLDVMEHLPGHPLRQLAELRRLLAPGGFCLVSGPNGASLMKRIAMLAGRYPYSPLDVWVTDPYYEHFREYVRGEYEKLLRLAEFQQVASYASAAVTHARSVHRYHRRRLGWLSPRIPLLWGLSVVEGLVPGLRHGVYAWGRA